ncbi:MAG: hypothetical protein M3065_05550 [Actinomycetota bacterium]|nr:hypothetical protein [Actinomycetota bacterium]
MNGAIVPALVAAGGGSSLLGGIYFYEYRRDSRMRSGRVAYGLTFPVGVAERAATAALAGLAGAHEAEVIFGVHADAKGIRHLVAVPAVSAEATIHHLGAALPGLRAELVEPPETPSSAISTLAVHLFVSQRSVLRTEDAEVASRSLLAGLGDLADGEQVVVRWAVRPWRARLPGTEPKTRSDRDLDRALGKRSSGPTFAVAGLLMARTPSKLRARSLLDGLGQVVRARRGQGQPLRLTYERAGRRLASVPKTSAHSGRITASELVGLLGFPLGDGPIPGVTVGASRRLPVPRDALRGGRRLFVGHGAQGDRAVGLSDAGARLHQALVGPTGSGKSTVAASFALDAIAAGDAGIVLDPKRDLVAAIADRIPRADLDRVVVLDLARGGAPVGLDLFGSGDPDLRADVLTSVLRNIYAPLGAWGVRSDHYVSLGLRTLAALEKPSLLLFGRLYSDARFRQAAVARLDDPVLADAWGTFEALGPAGQREHLAAPLGRVMGLLRNPVVRGTLAQPSPKLNLGQLWSERCWLLVTLDPGSAGEGAARMVGAVLGFLAWSTLETRVALPETERLPTTLVVDELQALSDGMPTSIERMAERVRAMNGRLLVSFQSSSRLPKATADAVFSNFATLVCFRPGAQEADRLARELPGLDGGDLMGLRPYEVAARVATGTGTGVVTVTGRTEPLVPATGSADEIRRRSAGRYGTPRAGLDQAFRELLAGPASDPSRPPAGRRGRRGA